MLNAFNLNIPLSSDFFKNIFGEIRSSKQSFKERFELDHDIDTGRHKKITLPSTGGSAQLPNNSAVLFFDGTHLRFSTKNQNNQISHEVIV